MSDKRRYVFKICAVMAALLCLGAGAARLDDGTAALLAASNAARRQAARPPLTETAALDAAARTRAREAAARFAHERPDGRACFTALREAGIAYASAGENLARGRGLTADEAVRRWLASPGHRRNLLRREFTQLGIGRYTAADGTVYWAQVFICPKEAR